MKHKATCLNCGWKYEDLDFLGVLVVAKNHITFYGKDGCETVVVKDKSGGFIFVKIGDDDYLKLKFVEL